MHMFMCAHVFLCVHMCSHMCMQAYGGQSSSSGVSPQKPCTQDEETGGLLVQGPPWLELHLYLCCINLSAIAWMSSVCVKHQEPSKDLNIYSPPCPRQRAGLSLRETLAAMPNDS